MEPSYLSCSENEHLKCKQFSQTHVLQANGFGRISPIVLMEWLLCGVPLGPTRLGFSLCLFFLFQISKLRLREDKEFGWHSTVMLKQIGSKSGSIWGTLLNTFVP